jgi:hypothetical protein
MRLSGTYFDRLVINVLPWTIFAAIVISFPGRNFNIYVFLILTATLWIMDTLIIYIKFRKPTSLRAENALQLGSQVINPNDIFIITPVTDNRMKWSFKMIEFTFKNGSTIMVIDKPQTFIEDLMQKPSKTLKKLFEAYPELKTKLRTRKFI